MDTEKKYICQEGLLLVNWVQIHNQSTEAIVGRGLSWPTAFQAAALCFCHLSWPLFIKEFLELFFNQWSEACPEKFELQNYSLIYIFADQSEQFLNEQSELAIPNNQDSAIWTNQNVQIKTPNLHRIEPYRNRIWTFSIKVVFSMSRRRAPLVSRFSLETYLPC